MLRLLQLDQTNFGRTFKANTPPGGIECGRVSRVKTASALRARVARQGRSLSLRNWSNWSYWSSSQIFEGENGQISFFLYTLHLPAAVLTAETAAMPHKAAAAIARGMRSWTLLATVTPVPTATAAAAHTASRSACLPARPNRSLAGSVAPLTQGWSSSVAGRRSMCSESNPQVRQAALTRCERSTRGAWRLPCPVLVVIRHGVGRLRLDRPQVF